MTSRDLTPRPTQPAVWDGLLTRRDLLRVGALGVAATALPAVLQPARAGTPPRAQSVLLLWMGGGVTHIDSFDPKPDAPEDIRGSLTSIATALPGVRFCETLPCLATQTRHFALVRSYSHDSNDHLLSQAYTLSGRKVTLNQLMTEPNIGSIIARLHGPRAGLPGYIAVPGTTRPGPPPFNLFVGGWLGREYAPFCTGGAPRNEDFTAKVAEAPEDEFNQQALRYPAEVDEPRLDGRRSLRQQLDATLRAADAARSNETLARQYGGAFDMLLSPAVRRAFDLAREPGRLRDGYGRTKIGQRCLLARRLVEAGARFVMVDYGYDPEYGNLWDNHCVPEQHQPPICEMVKRTYHVAGIDRAFAALLADLDARGLLDSTLVVFLTEFGRTPKINKLGGRDHWGAAGSIFFAGGGARGGQVIGATDRHAAQPTTTGYTPADVAATIYRALGVDPATLLHDRQNRPLPVLPEGTAIPGVLG
jgi:hypothetical protein